MSTVTFPSAKRARSAGPGMTSAGAGARDRISDLVGAGCASPSVWVLPSRRAGDGDQALALAEALGWPFEVKQLPRRRADVMMAPPFVASIAGVRRDARDRLGPPWPNLVVSSGRENEPVAQWIKRRSAGRTRLVHVGRPWGDIARYDLVVATPQYRLPACPNVLQNAAPLHRVDGERLLAAAGAWASRVAALPRPLIAVLVGGSSGPYAFTRPSGERLAATASALAARLGGSLLVTTSARTPRVAVEALREGLTCPHVLFRWRHDVEDNPYHGFLALADEIIVTGDSMSMIAEACATGKRVHLFDLGVGWGSMRAPLDLPGESAPQRQARPLAWLRDFSLRARCYRLALRYAPSRVTRDIRLVHRRLVAAGNASWLGDPRPATLPAPLDDVSRAVSRVRGLLPPATRTPMPTAPDLAPAA